MAAIERRGLLPRFRVTSQDEDRARFSLRGDQVQTRAGVA